MDTETLVAAAGAAAASRLRREYRLLRQIVEGTAAGVAVLDTELRYLYVNPHMARMTGLPAKAHLGRTLANILPGVQRSEEVLRQVLRDGRPRQLVGSGHTQAHSAYARREWRVTYHRLEDEQGAVTGVVGIGLEITEPRQYLHQLERSHHRITMLETAATAIGTTLDVDVTCTELVDFVVPGLADAASVALFEENRPGRPSRGQPGVTRLRRAAFRAPQHLTEQLGDLGVVDGYVEFEAGSPLRRCLDEGRPLLHDLRPDETTATTRHYAERAARYRAAGFHCGLVVPLTSESRPVGALSMARHGSSPAFTRDDVVVAQELATRTARALERAFQFARERTIALELQRALLSEPSTPHLNLETASRYLPASDSALVGGDWFDSLPMPEGRNLLVIGDVMGHGVEAAVAMSHYRSMLRALAANNLPLDEILRYADRMVAEAGFDRVATCLLALGDPRTHTISYANAGHLPPLRLTAEGRAEILPVPVGPPLGTGLGDYTVLTRPGLPGAAIVLYTDGLVERRGEDIDTSLARLTQLSLNPQDGLDAILDDILTQLTDGGPAEDDIALLAARLRTPVSRPSR
ncbi:SpoIIE family protein phosphatase [Streptomyces sp. ZAF1911]|uniref:SpoIIE family protein phosphatase n=1 Tax=Streptomyces sp. ZAF1911 TaxID=2944129 RepID=UPI00237B13D6|nr:SpoIIE family protein phosphatase [Streptomyces sp. ZAF1911]MDD9376904.1 SpoIIE family protein phosphatase [Streptomyces sp. ZAF1911]